MFIFIGGGGRGAIFERELNVFTFEIFLLQLFLCFIQVSISFLFEVLKNLLQFGQNIDFLFPNFNSSASTSRSTASSKIL